MPLLLEQNTDHLRQAILGGNPFTMAPLKELFGLDGTSKAADEILAGTFDLTTLGISKEVMTWLEELAYDNGPPTPVDVKITDTHFQSAVQGCNINTSASPSGFG